MRTWLVIGAAALALAGGIQGAEARGRGFGRVFSGRAPTPYRPVAAPAAARPEMPRSSRLVYQPALSITPARAAGAAAVPVAAAAGLRLSDEPGSTAPRPVLDPPPRVQEARAVAPPCAPERRIGGLKDPGAGFCLVN